MFWVAWLATVLIGLLSIGFVRTTIVRRWPRLHDLRLDYVLVALLILGALLTGGEHLQSETQLAHLRGGIVSASAVVDLVLDWPGNPGWSAVLTGPAAYLVFGRGTSPLLLIRTQQVIHEGHLRERGVIPGRL